MQEKINKNEPWVSGPSVEKAGKGILKSIYDFLISLVMGCVGLAAFAVCWMTVFRHGAGFSEISLLEFALFIWVLYCFALAKDQAKAQEKNAFLSRWQLLSMTGWTSFWCTLVFLGWFRWGAEHGFQKVFFATNTFEFSLIIVVALGCGLGVLNGVNFEEDKEAPIENQVKAKEAAQ